MCSRSSAAAVSKAESSSPSPLALTKAMDLAKAMDIPFIYPDDVDEAFKLYPDGNDAVERLFALSDKRAQAADVQLDEKYTSSFKAHSLTNADSSLFDSEVQEAATAAASFKAHSPTNADLSATAAAAFDAESLGNLSFSDLEHDPVVTPLADSDTTITANDIGEVPLELPTPDGNAQLDSFMDGFDSFLEQLQDPLPVLNMDQSEVDNNETLQDEPPLPFLKPLPSQLIPCPPDKIDDEDVTTPKLVTHYLYYHFFNGSKCSNCSVQVISQQSGHYNFCRMCHTRKESEHSIDVGVERDDNPNDVDELGFSVEELEKVRNLAAYQAYHKKPLRSLSKGSENAYRRKNLLVGSLRENDLSPPTYATFTRCVHGMGGSLRWYHIPILLRIFSLPFGYHVDHPELISTMEELVRKESQPSNGNFFFSLHTFRKAMRKSEIRVAKREQIGRNMSFIIRATLMMLDLIDIADSHCMVDVLINAFEADEVFPSLNDRAIVKYFAALHFTTSIVIKQCTLEFKKTSITEAMGCSASNVADVYLARAHSGTLIVDLIRNVSLHGFIPALSADINVLNARYPQLGGFLHAAFNPSSLRSYLVAMAGNHNTFDPYQVYVAVMSGEGSCGGGAWLLPLFQVAYISHLVRTGYSSHFGRYCCAFRYHRRRKGAGCSPHLISLRENNTCNDSDSSIRPTYQTFGPIRTDGTFENKGYPLMATMCRPHHKIEAMGVQTFLNETINTGVKQFDFNFDASDEEKRDFEQSITMMTKKVIESSEEFKREHRLRDSVGRLYSLLLSQSGRDAQESSRDVASLIAPP